MGVRNRTTAAASTQRFDDALDQTYQGVRGALTEVLISVKADPTKPQDMARRFGINKNLAWKISKIVTVPEPHSIISNLPGDTGMERILKAFESGGSKGPESAADEMARLGLSTYSSSAKAGFTYDPNRR